MEIRAIIDRDVVLACPELFDDAPQPDATDRFLADPGHHLLFAYDGDQAVGMISGVEMTHPDKGTEMFVYELGVIDSHQRRGVGRSLVDSLRELARARGCTGMWTVTDQANLAAGATYVRDAVVEPAQVVYVWPS